MKAWPTHAAHLVRRFVDSLSPRPPESGAETWAERTLLPDEVELWRQMSNQDRRHAIVVAHRLESALGAEASRPVLAAALLHDVGKARCGLGTFARVAATLLGPRLSRGRYACYHRHEEVGAALCVDAGSDSLTVSLIRGGGAPDALLAALHAADEV